MAAGTITNVTSAYGASQAFRIEDDPITVSISNPSNRYLKLEIYLNAVLLKTINLGQVATYLLSFSSGEIDDLYEYFSYLYSPPNGFPAALFRLKSYSDAGYTTQDGTNQDLLVTVGFNHDINRPTFTTYTIDTVAKDVEVRDKYDNLLLTTPILDLTGSADAMVAGYSKVRATILLANRGTATNSAYVAGMAMSAYCRIPEYIDPAGPDTPETFLELTEYEHYEGVDDPGDIPSNPDLTIDLDNVQTNEIKVRSFDNRPNYDLLTSEIFPSPPIYSLPVIQDFAIIAEYEKLNVFGVQAIRDNQVDPLTRLVFSGTFWNKYFASNTTVDPSTGERNEITVEYRYKQTNEAWAAQTWEDITGDVSITGDDISYDEYVEGDLGAGGFSNTKSFNIEVRAYDKLNAVIVEITLDKGAVILDWYDDGDARGVGVGAKYDPELGGVAQLDDDTYYKGELLEDLLTNHVRKGWIEQDLTATYVSADAPIYTLDLGGDHIDEFTLGDRFYCEQSNSNLVAYYPFNQGTPTEDGTANNHDLTAISTPDNISGGRYGYGVDFVGSEAYSIVDHANLKPTSSFSVGLWLKADIADSQYTVMQSWSQNTNRAGWKIECNAGGLAFYIGRNNGSTQGTHWQVVETPDFVINSVAWSWVVCTWDGVNMSIYVDGKLKAQTPWTFAPAYAGTNYVRIGCGNDSGTNNLFMGGDGSAQYDEVFIINGTALTEGQIYAMFGRDEEMTASLKVPQLGLVSRVEERGGDTRIKLYMGTNFALANATIYNAKHSHGKTPVGFLIKPSLWTVRTVDTSSRLQGSPTINVWYNPGSVSLSVPIGLWHLKYKAVVQSVRTSAASTNARATLSTTNNGETDKEMTVHDSIDSATGTQATRGLVHAHKHVDIVVTTTFYLNALTTDSSTSSVGFRNDFGYAVIEALSALL